MRGAAVWAVSKEDYGDFLGDWGCVRDLVIVFQVH